MSATLPCSVQMQCMRPSELERAAIAFPAVYVPFGLIEWHGPHLPLGTDAIKAHAIAVKAAEKHGGVVYPPLYFHSGFEEYGALCAVYRNLFAKLRDTGFRVIIGISGHNVQEQLDMIEAALALVCADGETRGAAMWEFGLEPTETCASDHAAEWETSDMMFFYPDLVDLAALGLGELKLDAFTPPWCMIGNDPRTHASAEKGAVKAEQAADLIGRKAHALLESLAPEHRTFRQKEIRCDRWFGI